MLKSFADSGGELSRDCFEDMKCDRNKICMEVSNTHVPALNVVAKRKIAKADTMQKAAPIQASTSFADSRLP